MEQCGTGRTLVCVRHVRRRRTRSRRSFVLQLAPYPGYRILKRSMASMGLFEQAGVVRRASESGADLGGRSRRAPSDAIPPPVFFVCSCVSPRRSVETTYGYRWACWTRREGIVEQCGTGRTSVRVARDPVARLLHTFVHLLRAGGVRTCVYRCLYSSKRRVCPPAVVSFGEPVRLVLGFVLIPRGMWW